MMKNPAVPPAGFFFALFFGLFPHRIPLRKKIPKSQKIHEMKYRI